MDSSSDDDGFVAMPAPPAPPSVERVIEPEIEEAKEELVANLDDLTDEELEELLEVIKKENAERQKNESRPFYLEGASKVLDLVKTGATFLFPALREVVKLSIPIALPMAIRWAMPAQPVPSLSGISSSSATSIFGGPRPTSILLAQSPSNPSKIPPPSAIW